MWNCLFYVKADQTNFEFSFCVGQVLLPVLGVTPLGPGIEDIAVQCKRSQEDYLKLNAGDYDYYSSAKYWKGTRRFLASAGQTLEQITEKPDLNILDAASPEAIADFVGWSLDKIPPGNPVIMTAWGHGGSWRIGLLMRVMQLPPGVLQNLQQFRTRVDNLAQEGALPIAPPVANDVGYSRLHGLPDLAKALGAGLARGRRASFDVFLFNSCFMACVEVAYELRTLAKYLVGSEEETPFEGWDHAKWMRELNNDPSKTPEQLAKLLVTTYGAKGRDDKTTMSALCLEPLGRLAERIRDFGAAARALDDEGWRAVKTARTKVKEYGRFQDQTGVDTVDMTTLFGHFAKDTPLQQTAQPVLDVLGKVIIEAEAGLRRSGDDYGSKGLSIFFPPSRSEYDGLQGKERYAAGNVDAPSFVGASGWRDFLDEYWRRTDAMA